jgi:hypothetical protein
VGVDHGRSNIGVTKQLLHRTDVVSTFQEMRREAVAEGVAGGGLLDASAPNGSEHSLLHGALMQVVPPLLSRAAVQIPGAGGEDVLPGPGCRGIRVLPRQCPWQLGPPEALAQVAIVRQPHSLQMLMKDIPQRGRQHGHSILAPLAVADDQKILRKVDISDPEPQRFQEPQPRSVQQSRNEDRRRLQLSEHPLRLVSREHDRKPARPFRTNHMLQVGERLLQDVTVQKDQRVQRLVLGGCRDLLPCRQVSEKVLDLLGAHLFRVAETVKPDEAHDPADVGLFSSATVVANTDGFADAVQQLRGLHNTGRRLEGENDMLDPANLLVYRCISLAGYSAIMDVADTVIHRLRLANPTAGSGVNGGILSC